MAGAEPITTPINYAGSDGWPLFAAQVTSPDIGEGAGVVVLMHGGGPDHHSLVPLARRLCAEHRIVLPDVRGYGRSLCADPAKHGWARYAEDVVALLDHLGASSAVVGGAGLGATITLRAAIAHPARVRAAVLISVEDIEDGAAKAAEIAFMADFARRATEQGVEAAWEPILPDLAPVIGAMVRDAIPRADRASLAAAATIGNDRSFRSVDELSVISQPVLIFPGMDYRHPRALAEQLARLLPCGELAGAELSPAVRSAEDFAHALAPEVLRFLRALPD